MLTRHLLRTGLVHLDPDTVTAAEVNAMVQGQVSAGPGIHTLALHRQLRRRGPQAPFLAHDLIAELNGSRSAFLQAGADMLRFAADQHRPFAEGAEEPCVSTSLN